MSRLESAIAHTLSRLPLERLIELQAALAAGTRRAETNEDLARAEGCQSGPKGNAQ